MDPHKDMPPGPGSGSAWTDLDPGPGGICFVINF